MLDIKRFFDKSSKSPAGRSYEQDLWLNPVKDKPGIYGNPKGVTSNGHGFEGEIDLNLKMSKAGKEYASGSLTINEVKLDFALFPAIVPKYPALKFRGRLTTGRDEARETIADISLIEFVNKESKEVSYSARLRTPYVKPDGDSPAIATEVKPPVTENAFVDDSLCF